MIIQVSAHFNHDIRIDVGRQFSHGTLLEARAPSIALRSRRVDTTKGRNETRCFIDTRLH
ncbi:hypothetical protein CK224_08340 [Mesorhizobium sp. WSM3862]|nr:hypothetical protein CK224_08340 [Mesorhizobium sp. WSM3862]